MLEVGNTIASLGHLPTKLLKGSMKYWKYIGKYFAAHDIPPLPPSPHRRATTQTDNILSMHERRFQDFHFFVRNYSFKKIVNYADIPNVSR